MRRKHVIRSDDRATAAGPYAPPRKLLRASGAVEMWQVEVPGQRWRKTRAIRYEVAGGPAGTVVFNRPSEALAYFQQVVRGSQ
jgi:hypothetical protein